MEEKNTSKNFLVGATIIAASHIIVKLIGALFRIPLANLIGPEGMAVYQAAYSIYMVLFTISTAGLPVAISKIVSEYIALNREDEVKNVFSVSYKLLLWVGLIGTAALVLGAKLFAQGMGVPEVFPALIALAPSLLFVALSSVYRGYFQGKQNMIPTALSEVIEAVCKLGIGLVFAYALLSFGSAGSASGAILGVTTGALGSLIYLFIYYSKNKIKVNKPVSLDKTKRNKLIRRIILIAIPVTLGSSVFTLTATIDTFMVLRRLMSIGFSPEQAKVMFGYYSGYAITLFNLPASVIVGISISIVPAISAAMAVKKIKEASESIASSVRITWQLALPAGLGMAALASPILHFLYPAADFVIPKTPEGVSAATGFMSIFANNGDATFLLALLGLAISLVCITMLTNSILQALGKVWVPVMNMFIGGAFKILANYVLVGIPQLNIMGAPISTTLCYLIITVLNLIFISKSAKPEYSFAATILKPGIAGVLMILGAIFTYNFVSGIVSSGIISLGAGIGVAVVVYFGVMFILKGFKKEDMMLLPKGDKLARKLNKVLK